MITATTTTLLDEALRDFDVRTRHSRRVDASPERIVEALDRFEIRGRASLLARVRGLRIPRGPIIDALVASGFTVLAERPGAEVVLGTTGQFWKLREQSHMEAPRDIDWFRAFDRPGWAQAAVSLRLEPLVDGSTLVTTETRVRCVDDAAGRRFAPYWLLIKPFSGWLRRHFLRRVARIAERAE